MKQPKTEMVSRERTDMLDSVGEMKQDERGNTQSFENSGYFIKSEMGQNQSPELWKETMETQIENSFFKEIWL